MTSILDKQISALWLFSFILPTLILVTVIIFLIRHRLRTYGLARTKITGGGCTLI
jgi:hypothetical protein